MQICIKRKDVDVGCETADSRWKMKKKKTEDGRKRWKMEDAINAKTQKREMKAVIYLINH